MWEVNTFFLLLLLMNCNAVCLCLDFQYLSQLVCVSVVILNRQVGTRQQSSLLDITMKRKWNQTPGHLLFRGGGYGKWNSLHSSIKSVYMSI
ncbi:hypothetical protein L2E82_14436 [Cichorium intybus]|uniref:Uncharacterized protein n=1 Tax=Cichorium intybus TaxID=13427 RepID=A0ACB9F0L4_CICIN|nr:hypothetical protein L2E82_14436 [Cichorium intybus]